jgi:hypothetical protein
MEDGRNAGDCPSSQQGFGNPMRILGDRQVVIKADDRNLPAVEAGCLV